MAKTIAYDDSKKSAEKIFASSYVLGLIGQGKIIDLANCVREKEIDLATVNLVRDTMFVAARQYMANLHSEHNAADRIDRLLAFSKALVTLEAIPAGEGLMKERVENTIRNCIIETNNTLVQDMLELTEISRIWKLQPGCILMPGDDKTETNNVIQKNAVDMVPRLRNISNNNYLTHRTSAGGIEERKSLEEPYVEAVATLICLCGLEENQLIEPFLRVKR